MWYKFLYYIYLVYLAFSVSNYKNELKIAKNKVTHEYQYSNHTIRTGSGKELVARKIHKNSVRSKEPFVILNAALLKEKTYEKELIICKTT